MTKEPGKSGAAGGRAGDTAKRRGRNKASGWDKFLGAPATYMNKPDKEAAYELGIKPRTYGDWKAYVRAQQRPIPGDLLPAFFDLSRQRLMTAMLYTELEASKEPPGPRRDKLLKQVDQIRERLKTAHEGGAMFEQPEPAS